MLAQPVAECAFSGTVRRYCEEKGLLPLPALNGRDAKLAAINSMRTWEPAAGAPLDTDEQLLRLGPSKFIVLYRRADISGLKLRCAAAMGRGRLGRRAGGRLPTQLDRLRLVQLVCSLAAGMPLEQVPFSQCAPCPILHAGIPGWTWRSAPGATRSRSPRTFGTHRCGTLR